MKNFVTVFFDRALENGHKMIFHNFCHFEAISFGTNFLRLLSFSMVYITVRQLKDCRILFWSPSQPMGCFSKKMSRVTIFIENFCSNESDVSSMEKTKSKDHCQLSTTIWIHSQITYLLQKIFSQQNLKNELLSTTWKFLNANRNATSLVVRLKTVQTPLHNEQHTPVL